MKNSVDTIWVRQQFERARIRVGVGTPVLDLLETWGAMDVDPKEIPEILDIFRKVAQGHALLPSASTEVWIQVSRGNVSVGDVVRVQVDAFSDAAGKYHNGRVGVVVGIRSGDVIFRSTDEAKPFIDGAHYPPERLERLVHE